MAVSNISVNKSQENSAACTQRAFPTKIPEIESGKVRRRAARIQTFVLSNGIRGIWGIS